MGLREGSKKCARRSYAMEDCATHQGPKIAVGCTVADWMAKI